MTLRPRSRVVAARGDRGRAQPRCPFGTQQRHGGEGDQSTEGDPVSNDVDRVEDTYGRVSLRASRQQGDRRLDEAGGEPESRSGEDAPAKGPRDSAACCDVEGAQLLEETFRPPVSLVGTREQLDRMLRLPAIPNAELVTERAEHVASAPVDHLDLGWQLHHRSQHAMCDAASSDVRITRVP